MGKVTPASGVSVHSPRVTAEPKKNTKSNTGTSAQTKGFVADRVPDGLSSAKNPYLKRAPGKETAVVRAPEHPDADISSMEKLEHHAKARPAPKRMTSTGAQISLRKLQENTDDNEVKLTRLALEKQLPKGMSGRLINFAGKFADASVAGGTACLELILDLCNDSDSHELATLLHTGWSPSVITSDLATGDMLNALTQTCEDMHKLMRLVVNYPTGAADFCDLIGSARDAWRASYGDSSACPPWTLRSDKAKSMVLEACEQFYDAVKGDSAGQERIRQIGKFVDSCMDSAGAAKSHEIPGGLKVILEYKQIQQKIQGS